MKNLFIKSLASLAIVASTMFMLPTAAHAEWRQNSVGWWYNKYFSSPSYSIGWEKIDNKLYYFDSNGYMVHDTVVDGYSIDSTGAKQSKVTGSCYWGADLLHMDFQSSGGGSYSYADSIFHTSNPSYNKTTILDNLNNEYTNFLLLKADTKDAYSYIEFPLNGQYKQFKSKLGLPKEYQEGLVDGLIKISVDGKDVYETNISSGDTLKDVSIDLTGKQKVRFFFLVNEIKTYGAEIGFFNGEFIK